MALGQIVVANVTHSVRNAQLTNSFDAGDFMLPKKLILVGLAVAILGWVTPSCASESATIVAAGSSKNQGSNAQDAGNQDADKGDKSEPTPEQEMQKRFPQPVHVGHLLAMPMLDDSHSTIGYVRTVARSPEGKIFLVVPYSTWFGWARTEWGKRAVAVPIEVVGIMGRQLVSLDMSRDDFDEAPTWEPSQGQPISPNEKILVALGRR